MSSKSRAGSSKVSFFSALLLICNNLSLPLKYLSILSSRKSLRKRGAQEPVARELLCLLRYLFFKGNISFTGIISQASTENHEEHRLGRPRSILKPATKVIIDN